MRFTKKNLLRQLPGALCLALALCLGAGQARAELTVQDEEEMLLSSSLIALVDIVELTATEKGTPYSTLTAKAQLTHSLKGVTMKTELEFRIPRVFPCAAFDMSTGMHLVFLKRDKNGKLVGTNWYMSYVYLGGKKARWYDKNGVLIELGEPEELIKRVKQRIAKAAATGDDGKKGKSLQGEMRQERKPTT